MPLPTMSHPHSQHQHQHQHPHQQQQHHQQPMQHSIPPAPTFASLGGTVLPYPGTLGSLAQGHHAQTLPGAQGLSAAIPPSAYLMQQTQQLLQQHHQQQQQQQQQAATERKSTRREDTNSGLVLPLHKVKRLIKSESAVKAVSGEASFAIARATELLLEQLLERANQRITAANRESIEYEDIAAIVLKWPATDFLRDTVPETQTLQELIERVKRQDQAMSQTLPGNTVAAKEATKGPLEKEREGAIKSG